MFQTSSNDVVYVLGVTLQNKTLKFFFPQSKAKIPLETKILFLCVKKMNLGKYKNSLKFLKLLIIELIRVIF